VRIAAGPALPDGAGNSAQRASAVALPGLAGDLASVDRALQESVSTPDGFLADTTADLVGSSRDRLRPTLALGAVYATDGPIADAIIGGAACELVHLGSRYHDDVIDEAETRHGVPRVNAHWSNIVAILAGDLLLARASSLAASLGAAVAASLAEAIGEISRGRMLELEHQFDRDRSERDYESAISGKTAALLATSCRVGAMVSNASDESVDALTRFGYHLGMCFQIVEDVLDLSGRGSAATPEKAAGRDLVEGIYTLPVIFTVRESPDLRALLGRPLTDEQLMHAHRILMTSTAIARARELARDHAERATEALAGADALRPDACAALIQLVNAHATRDG
jgi:heptaprenyl diphosphate synthase